MLTSLTTGEQWHSEVLATPTPTQGCKGLPFTGVAEFGAAGRSSKNCLGAGEGASGYELMRHLASVTGNCWLLA